MTTELMTLEDLQKELAVVATQEGSAEKSAGGRHLSVKGKRFSLGEERLGDELDVVVVATSFENAYYNSAYDPNNIQPPACFAIAVSDDGIGPHETSPDPQSDACATCPMNEWGSGSGKGKACKNRRRLVLLACGVDGVEFGQVVVLNLPPTSIKNWSAYSKAVTARTKMPTFAAVTRLSFDPKSDWPTVVMDYVRPINDVPTLMKIRENMDEYTQVALEPYDVSKYSAEESKSTNIKKSKMS